MPGQEGKRASPYTGGMFRIRLKVPDTYPSASPEVYFATKTWHPNVDWATGKVCMDDVFGGNAWKPTMGIRTVLQEVRNMLAERTDGGVNAEARKEMAEDLDAFDKHAKDITTKYAMD